MTSTCGKEPFQSACRLQTRDRQFHVKEPKTAASKRTIALPTSAVHALTERKADAMKTGLLDAPVFCTRTGNFLNKNNVLRAFRTIVKHVNTAIAERKEKDPANAERAIPESIRFHDLRHTVASLLLSKGCSLRAVSARLGHANAALTLRVYGALPAERRRPAC